MARHAPLGVNSSAELASWCDRDRELELQPTITVGLVKSLITTQFPQWADLSVTQVVPGGVDNRTFRLGEKLLVRLPSAEGYALQVEKEQKWLPRLAPQLPLRIPVPVGRGRPGLGYPFGWSVYEWLNGDIAGKKTINSLTGFASSLANFLVALQRIDSGDGPAAGAHSAFRGAPLVVYERETLEALDALQGRVDVTKAREVWETAVTATSTKSQVWFHGDVAVGNLLVGDGQLAAVLDFGCSGVGDPACDLVIAWTLFREESREVFRSTLAADDAAWARGRGWALWKALITLADTESTEARSKEASLVIDEVLAD